MLAQELPTTRPRKGAAGVGAGQEPHSLSPTEGGSHGTMSKPDSPLKPREEARKGSLALNVIIGGGDDGGYNTGAGYVAPSI